MGQTHRCHQPRRYIHPTLSHFGHQRAITAGMHHCQGDAAIIIDADLQDPPEVIADLIEKWNEGYEVVHAVSL